MRRILEDWLATGFNPWSSAAISPRPTTSGERLARGPAEARFPKLDLRVITSEDPDELRKERIAEMAWSQGPGSRRDRLPERRHQPQDLFTAVLHYDLPWNPNRLEQREGG